MKRVLIADDDADVRELVEFKLRQSGWEVSTARDGEEALAQLIAAPPDVAVLDIMMPKLDGYETCKRLKADEATRSIPIILLSAKGRNIDQKIGFEVGADDYITNPFSPRKIVELINAILGQEN